MNCMMNRNKPKTPLHNWTNTGSFMNRPQGGWLHPKELLSPDLGITYAVTFLGSIVVLESMKSLDFSTRTAIAKECIYRVCSFVYPKALFRRTRQNCLFFTQRSTVDNYLADELDLQFSETEVNLTVTVDNLSVLREDNGNLLYHHRMQMVSFASGGDADMIDFIAYIAKDDTGRKCHVMECTKGLANDVITTIGQAFELRFKQHLLQKPPPITVPDRLDLLPGSFDDDDDNMQSALLSDSKMSCDHPSPSPRLPPYQSPLSYRSSSESPGKSSVFSFSEASASGCDSPILRNRNDSTERIRVGSVVYTKPFKPFTSHMDGINTCMNEESKVASPAKIMPYDEPWFHGKISRQECENRLLHNGDFLVRESPKTPGQFVLSGRNDGDVKHLLLIDPEGRVRTKDQLFSSVSHLISYHLYNSVPIVTVDVELLLVFPIRRPDVLD